MSPCSQFLLFMTMDPHSHTHAVGKEQKRASACTDHADTLADASKSWGSQWKSLSGKNYLFFLHPTFPRTRVTKTQAGSCHEEERERERGTKKSKKRERTGCRLSPRLASSSFTLVDSLLSHFSHTASPCPWERLSILILLMPGRHTNTRSLA